MFHRDVKPDNILLGVDATGQLSASVADFGVSKADATATMGGTMAGSVGYLAPEVMDGLFSSRSDVYSFGVLLLVFATGRPAVRVEGTGNAARTVFLAKEVLSDAAKLTPISKQCDPGVSWDPPALAEGLIRLGLYCTRPDRRERPAMSDVELALADLLAPDGGASNYLTHLDLVASPPGIALTCLVCDSRPRDAVLLPCSHAVACGPCAAELLLRVGGGNPKGPNANAGSAAGTCPVCRVPVESSVPAVGPVARTWQGKGGVPPPISIQVVAEAINEEDPEVAEIRAALAEKKEARRKEAEAAAVAAAAAKRKAEEARMKEAKRKAEEDAAWQESFSSLKYKYGTVDPPPAFDVTVAVGSNVQEAVDGCREGGCVLVSPGTHSGPLTLSKEVHLFGLGKATLQAGKGSVITSTAAKATVSGFSIRKLAVDGAARGDYGVWIKGGGLRLQGCDVVSEAWSGVANEGGPSSDPLIVDCK